jgi:hypothetical protein
MHSMNKKTCKQCGNEFSVTYSVTKEYWRKRKFCSHKCSSDWTRGRHRLSFGKPLKTIEQRFWEKVKRPSLFECWDWTGALEGTGYGYLGNTRRQGAIKAHRLSYEIHCGEIPAGMCVCHTCDNRKCVNPKHLFLGTRADNNTDRDRKGRTNKMYGESNPKAKLTNADIISIRKMRSDGVAQQAIADIFGVSQNAISRIDRRKTWAKV